MASIDILPEPNRDSDCELRVTILPDHDRKKDDHVEWLQVSMRYLMGLQNTPLMHELKKSVEALAKSNFESYHDDVHPAIVTIHDRWIKVNDQPDNSDTLVGSLLEFHMILLQIADDVGYKL